VQRQSGAYELGEHADLSGAPASRRVKTGTAARLSLSWLECVKSVSWYVEQLYSSLTMIVSGQKYSQVSLRRHFEDIRGEYLHHEIELYETAVQVERITVCSLGLSATSQQYFSLRTNQPAVLFSQNKTTLAISHQPTEQAVRWKGCTITDHCWSIFAFAETV
jgi:hypothetical protein